MEPLIDFNLRNLFKLVECDNDYKCNEEGLENFSRIKVSKNQDLALCNSKKCNLCNYATIIGEKRCCMCPVLNYLRKKQLDKGNFTI